MPHVVGLELVPDPFGSHLSQIDAGVVGEGEQIAIDHEILERAPRFSSFPSHSFRICSISSRSTDGSIILNHHEAGEIRPALFQQACKMGLEGIVSKRRDRPYQAGHMSTPSS